MTERPDHRPRKRFGQNFLQDRNIIQRIIAAIAATPDQHLVEIGPGHGALTDNLQAQAGQLDLVELDRDLAAELTEKYRGDEHIHIHQGDALKFDFCGLPGPQPLRVVGNLPYNISTPLLFHLLDQVRCIRDMHFMLQKEVVDRMVAVPGNKHYGRLSIMLQYRCQVSRLFNVPPGAFYPPPRVDSSIVRLLPHAELPCQAADPGLFAQLVNAAFSHRRKTLRNALKGLVDSEQFTAAGIDPGARAETLAVCDFVRLANTDVGA
jgi:16S rRNA (adenine1518-N6/adenine1519-N6)-dimethyltransferase